MTDTSRLLNDHIDRMGLKQALYNDPTTYATVTITRGILGAVEAAMQDEGIDPEVITRVIRLTIYGSMPNPQDIAEKQLLHKRLVDLGSRSTAPAVTDTSIN